MHVSGSTKANSYRFQLLIGMIVLKKLYNIEKTSGSINPIH